MQTSSMNSHKMMSKLALILFSCLLFLQPAMNTNMNSALNSRISSSCTIFTVSVGDTVYFGNNEDYKYNNAYCWYIPTQNVSTTYFGIQEIYGAVFFGFDNNNDSDVDGWEQGGMNEHGLCYDGNGLPDILLNCDPSALYPYTSHALAQVLWQCKNVSEVIEWYQNIKWSGYFGCQIHYADSNGDAVVVGVDSEGKWVFTRKENNYFVSTNFSLENNTLGSYPCWRYDKATEMLGSLSSEEDLTVSACANILYEVHQEGTYATKYSNICDPVNKYLYFNKGEEFSEYKMINLIDKLSDTEVFEEKASFFGVSGVDGGVLVNTEQIDIQFETIPAEETNGTTLIVSTLGILLCVALYTKQRKRK